MQNRWLVVLWGSLLLLTVQCVSSKKYRSLQQRYSAVDSAAQVTRAQNILLARKVLALQKDTAQCNAEVHSLIQQYNALATEHATTKKRLEKEVQQLSMSLREYKLKISDQELKVAELQRQLSLRDSIADTLMARLEKSLLQFTSNDLLRLKQERGRVYVSLTEELLFPSGSTTINPRGKDALKQVALALNQRKDLTITIEGHTDSIPIRTAKYRDNWDLSVLRATAVVRLLTETYGVDPSQVIASGRSAYYPIYPNNTPDGRQQNRRIEIIITPKLEVLYNLLDNR